MIKEKAREHGKGKGREPEANKKGWMPQNRFCYFAAFYDSYSNKWPEDDTTCISDLSKKRSDNTHNGRSCESW